MPALKYSPTKSLHGRSIHIKFRGKKKQETKLHILLDFTSEELCQISRITVGTGCYFLLFALCCSFLEKKEHRLLFKIRGGREVVVGQQDSFSSSSPRVLLSPELGHRGSVCDRDAEKVLHQPG